MALYRETNLALNKVYEKMFTKKQKQLKEAVTAGNSVHSDVEAMMNDFASTIKNEIDSESVKEKLRKLEALELTKADKNIIKAIDKLVDAITKAYDDFEKFKKGLKYDYILSKKGEPESTDASPEGDMTDVGDAEDELKSADKQFENPDESDEDL
jgi:hypothetical protein